MAVVQSSYNDVETCCIEESDEANHEELHRGSAS